ncbi:MAG: serine/threonine-protein kinase [Planctomycetota bacterium]
MSESKPDPMIGREVDGYRIEEIIGRGGMGTVYKAQQLSLGRPVAIKVLSEELAQDDQFLTRFHREADALSRLSHPNIVTVLERGDVDKRPYLAMEYVEGSSLRQIIREGKLPPAEAFRIVSSVLAALQHAHDKGIVHRDIKPENVLLARGDVVKVADFGLSLLVDGPDLSRLTRTNLVLGTYEYMAPEQREHAREADHRADLYATGVILYELLTGELPIGRFPLPSRQRPQECDTRMDRIVERSLEKDPGERYQDAGDMASAVSAVLERPSSAPPRTTPPPPPSRPTSSVHYRPARLEHHIDNLATIDQVLGTVFYILGALALFGSLRVPFLFTGGFGFLFCFVLGWYLRETGEELRKYKISARTSQAVIAVIAAFTGVLIPFTIYSFWVLFSHRGRTYYDARNRGLSENEAARHTFDVVEDDIISSIAPEPPPPPGAPRPSQIPVQSMVTSSVEPDAKPRKRMPRMLVLGMLLAISAIVMHLFAVPIEIGYQSPVAIIVAAAAGLLLLGGILQSLFARSGRGTLWGLLFAAGLVGAVLATHVNGASDFGFAHVDRVIIGTFEGDRPSPPDHIPRAQARTWLNRASEWNTTPWHWRLEQNRLVLEMPRAYAYRYPDRRAALIAGSQAVAQNSWAGFRAHPINVQIPSWSQHKLEEPPQAR